MPNADSVAPFAQADPKATMSAYLKNKTYKRTAWLSGQTVWMRWLIWNKTARIWHMPMSPAARKKKLTIVIIIQYRTCY